MSTLSSMAMKTACGFFARQIESGWSSICRQTGSTKRPRTRSDYTLSVTEAKEYESCGPDEIRAGMLDRVVFRMQ
jgi:hypothetical protein